MVKKFFKFIIAFNRIAFGIGFLFTSVVFIVMIFKEAKGLLDVFTLILAALISLGISYFLLVKKNNKFKSRSMTDKPKENTNIYEEIAKNQNRIARDSIELINNTANPDVFFSRYDLALENSRKKDQKILQASFDELTKDFLYRFNNAVINKLLSLKTTKARQNNINKFNSQLEPYIDRISSENLALISSFNSKWKEYLIVEEKEKIETPTAPATNIVPKVNKIIINSETSLVESKELILGSESLSIPLDIFELLWFKNGPFENIEGSKFIEYDTGFSKIFLDFSQGEPSAIDISLPIKAKDDNEDLGYYPSYEGLSPSQRWKYLNWLKDINKPIEIGYVFIFYYGLERFLFTDKIDKAVDMILRLQKYHNNFKSGSFDSYSSDAILIASLINRNPAWLKELDPDKLNPQAYASVKGASLACFTAEDIIRFSRFVGWTNKRYINGYYNMFLEELKDILNREYPGGVYQINKEDYKLVKKPVNIVLANYSLDYEKRSLLIPDILSLPSIKKDLFKLLEETHENVKVKLRELRKKK